MRGEPESGSSGSSMSLSQPETSSGPSTSFTQPVVEGDAIQDIDLAKIIEMFPHLSEHQLKYLLGLSNHPFTCAVDCALEGPSIESLRSLAVRTLKIPLQESPRI